MNRIFSMLGVACLALALVSMSSCVRRQRGVVQADYNHELAPGESGLQELSIAEFPHVSMRQSSRWALKKAIAHSLKYLTAPSSYKKFPVDGITHEQVRRGLQLFAAFLDQHPHASDAELNQFIRSTMRVYRSIGYDGKGNVLFTGYYTPIFTASAQRTAVYQYPLYKRPADLVSGITSKDISHQRLADGRLLPYPSRAALLQSGQLNGQELAWFSNPFDAFIIHVQGSARLRMIDGRELEIGYNGTNGHDYKSVAQALIRDGHMKHPSLQRMRDFFAANPQRVRQYLNENPRFVFFTETTGGPYGSLGQEVTADVSIATDKSIFPPSALCWLHADSVNTELHSVPYGGFKLDQDTGGAIRAAGRCDIYMGVGAQAEQRAGRQLSHGQFYYMIAK